MGRVKLPISRILNNTSRQVTYSKRRNGLLKKAYEIAVLCDIDVALIMISPSGRITFFSGTKRIEDVLLQYFSLTDDEIELDQDTEGLVVNRENVVRTLMRLKTEATAHQSPNNQRKHLEEIVGLQHQLEMAKEQLRAFEPDPQKFTSLNQIESYEAQLLNTLSFIEQRKKNLLNNHSSCYHDRMGQMQSMVPCMMNGQDVCTQPTLVNPNFSSWLEHLSKDDRNEPKYMQMGSATSPIFHENQSSGGAVMGVVTVPTLHNDKLTAEGYKFRNLSEECLHRWQNSPHLYPTFLPQQISDPLLNGIHIHPDAVDATAASITPLQHNQTSCNHFPQQS